MIEQAIFYFFALLAIGGALGVLFFSHPLQSALSFIVTLLAVAGFFLLLHAKLLFILQIVVYAGAIMVLMIFVIMYLNIKPSHLFSEGNKLKTVAVSALLALPLFVLFIVSLYKTNSIESALLPENFGEIEAVSTVLYERWMVPFELVSLLLTAAFVGAVVIASNIKAKDVA